MIQSAAPAVANASAPLSGQPAANGTPGAESGGFAELLADHPTADGAAPSARVPAPASAPDALAASGLALPQANVAGTLPLTGKILPGVLPDVLPDAATAAAPVGEPDPATPRTPDVSAIPTLLAAMRALRLPVPELPGARQAAGLPGAASPATAQTDDTDADADAAPAVAQPFTLAALVPAAPATGPAPAPADPALTGQTGLPPMIEAQLLGRPLALREADQPGSAATAIPAAKADGAPADLALKIDPARVDPAATAALSFGADAARPMSGVRLRPVLAADTDTAALTASTAAAPDGTGMLATPAATAAPLANPVVTGGVPAARPHDFAALMDRLITARDAAQTGLPQSVSVAVNHAEFGPISLQFQHDQRGLAVSVASADPDFARAVQAAIPAAAAAAASDGAARDTAQGSGGQQAWSGQGAGPGRGDASAAGGEAGQRQGRAARFAAETGPALNRGAEARDAAPSRQRGIFA